jgi:hypothetical protein
VIKQNLVKVWADIPVKNCHWATPTDNWLPKLPVVAYAQFQFFVPEVLDNPRTTLLTTITVDFS